MKTASVLGRRPLGAARRKIVRPTRQPTLYDLLKDFDGLATDLPADLAANHDHYLYGSPKTAKR